jgi:hypothetical protein
MNRFRKSENRIDHQYVEERLSAFLDGQLPAKEDQAVRRHLDSCPACRWQLSTLQQTVQWTGELPTIPVPRVFTLPASVQEKRSPGILAPRPRRSFVPLLQGATALIAVLLVFVVAGDVLFNTFAPAPASQPVMMLEQAPQVAATAQPIEPTTEVQAMVVEEAEEMAVEETPPPAPSPAKQKAAPGEADAEAALEAGDAAPAAEAEKAPMQSMGAQALPSQEAATIEEAPARAAETTEEPAFMAADVEPTASVTPTSPPPEPSATIAPTSAAQAQESGAALPEQGVQPAVGAFLQPLPRALRLAEVGLGTALLLLGTITIIVMIGRRRS